jgi:hypothetical protein
MPAAGTVREAHPAVGEGRQTESLLQGGEGWITPKGRKQDDMKLTIKEKRLVSQYRHLFCTQARIDVAELIERKDMSLLIDGVNTLEQISCLGQFRLLKRLADEGLLKDLPSKEEKDAYRMAIELWQSRGYSWSGTCSAFTSLHKSSPLSWIRIYKDGTVMRRELDVDYYTVEES